MKIKLMLLAVTLVSLSGGAAAFDLGKFLEDRVKEELNKDKPPQPEPSQTTKQAPAASQSAPRRRLGRAESRRGATGLCPVRRVLAGGGKPHRQPDFRQPAGCGATGARRQAAELCQPGWPLGGAAKWAPGRHLAFRRARHRGYHAFAAPGGYIFVTKGLYRLLNNEADLAGCWGMKSPMSPRSIISRC